MSDITVALPDELGTVTFPAGTPKDVIEREAANAYLKARGAAKGKADAKTDGAAQAFGGGVLQNAGDEFTAAIRSALPGLSNWMMSKSPFEQQYAPNQNKPAQTVSDAPTYDQRYEEELSRERAKAAQYRKDNPVTATSLNIAGAVAPVVLASMAGVPMAPSMNGGAVANTAKAALTGAAYGGVSGFNEGEGGFEDRLKQAGTGAALGGGFGAAGLWAGRGLGAAADYAATTKAGQAVLNGAGKVADAFERLGMVPNKSLSAAAPEGSMISGDNAATYAADQIRAAIPTAEDAVKKRAAQFVAAQLERGKLTPDQAVEELKKLGMGGVFADVNESLFRLGRLSKNLPGETENYVRKNLEDRARMWNPELRGSIEGPNGKYVPEDVYFRGDLPDVGGNIFQQNARQVGRRAYQGEMVDAGLKQPEELRRMLDDPTVKSALERVMGSVKAARAMNPNIEPPSPVEIMHMVKQELQGLGFDSMSGRPLSTQQVWRDASKHYVDTLKQANPKLAEADVAYAKAKSLPDAYDAGLGTFGKDGLGANSIDRTAAAVEHMMKSADLAKANAAEWGAVNAGRVRTGGTDANAVGFAREIVQSESVRRKVQAIFGDRADEIFKTAEGILRKSRTNSRLLNASATAESAADIGIGAGPLNDVTVRATPGGILPRITESIGKMIDRVQMPNEPTRNVIGRMMFSLDPAEQAATMEAVQRVLAERAAQRQGGAVWGGMAGGYGSEAFKK